MPSLTLNGPAIPTDTNNVMLRDVRLSSPIERAPSTTNYHVIEVGVREGEFTTWIGTWTQYKQKVDGATPTSILDADRLSTRLKAGQALVVKITSYGSPASLEGSRLNFTLSLVGGRDGPARPLVAAGAMVADANTRTSIAALERQINTGGLSEWDEAVQLQDPVSLVIQGTFGGRLQRDSATQISLQRYTSNWVEVNGEAVSITSSGLATTSTSGLISNGGTVTSTLPSSSTLYYVYVGTPLGGVPQLRLSATAPSAYLGAYYLGTDIAARTWRFCGWVRTNSSTQFVDDTTDRLVVNYYNRLWKTILLRPAYSDGNSVTSYTTTSTTYTAANGGTGATASYIANGEDGLLITAFGKAKNSGAAFTRIGIGDNSGSTCATAAEMFGTTDTPLSCTYSVTPASGYRTIVLLVCVSAGTGTYFADDARAGSATDPAKTALYTLVPV